MSIEAKTILMKRLEAKLSDKVTLKDQTILLESLSEILYNFEVEQRDAAPTEDDMLDAYISAKTIEGRSRATLDRYAYLIRQLMRSVNVSTREVTVYHIRKHLSELKNKGLSDRTIESIRQVFSAYFNWLQREGLIQTNPTANLGVVRCEKKIVETFSDVEIEQMKEACRNLREKALILFFVSTGCRVSEVVGLNRDDLDMKAKMCKVHGKGNKQRLVYFDSVTAMIMMQYLASRHDENEALFINRSGERIQPGGVRWLFGEIEKRSGVEHVHPHRFRRTCATKLISRGMSIQNVAKILGHDKLETTMKYVKLDDRMIHNAFDMCS